MVAQMLPMAVAALCFGFGSDVVPVRVLLFGCSGLGLVALGSLLCQPLLTAQLPTKGVPQAETAS